MVCDETFDVDGVHLWALRRGSGRASGQPAVVFLPGGGSVGLDHLLVVDALGEDVTSVLYDRAGTGFSDDVALPRAPGAVVAELRSMLDRMAIGPPYVLVGHSLGGAYARRYAQLHPADVVGLVLLDPLHERYDTYHDAPLTDAPAPEQVGQEFLTMVADQVRSLVERMLVDFPVSAREPLRAAHLRPDRVATTLREGMNLTTLTAELAAAPDPQVPTIVLGATGVDVAQTGFVPREQLERVVARQQRLYADHAAAGPDREYRALPGCSHSTITFEAVDDVVAAIRDLLSRVGRG